MTKRIGIYLLTFLFCSVAYGQNKPRVAVMDFEYGTVQTYVSAWFGANEDIGKGIRDLTVEKLVNGGKFSVIERSILDKILAEQDDSNSNRFDSSSAAKIGKVLGVDAIIIGSITKFGRDDQNTQVGGGAFSGLTGGIGGFGRKKATAVVAVTARIIDVDTAEILAVVTGNGESMRKSTSIGGGGRSGGSGGGGGFSMGASGFGETIIGEATLAAVEEVVAGLAEHSAKIEPSAPPVVEGLVADFAGGLITLTVGTNQGVKAGSVFSVNKVVREILHPVTGAVIRRVEETVGTVRIEEVGEDWALGSLVGASALACDSGDFTCFVAKAQ